MVDKDIVLEALSVICNAPVRTGVQPRASRGNSTNSVLNVQRLIPTVLDTEEHCNIARGHYDHICSLIQGSEPAAPASIPTPRSMPRSSAGARRQFWLDPDEFFDPRFDFDFTHIKDTQTYYRGNEVYTRPTGWTRIALKILDKYPDGNAWLGHTGRGTQSVGGEWPVSYHGTSKKGAEGIVSGHYKPGPGQAYGRGIYSTPFINDADQYAKSFVSQIDGKTYKVLMQNRINPNYREIHFNSRYWLVRISPGSSAAEEQKLVERAIRPYGMLLKVA